MAMGLVSVLVDTWGKGLARTNLLSNNEGLGMDDLSTGRGDEVGRGIAVDEEASNRTDFRRTVDVAGPGVALVTGRRIEVDRTGSFVPAGTTIAQGDDLGVVETRVGGVTTSLVARGTATRTVAFPLFVSFVPEGAISVRGERGVVVVRETGRVSTFALLEGATIAQGERGVMESRAEAVGFLMVSLIVDWGVVESRGTGLCSRTPPCFRTGPALVFVSLAARGTRAVVLVDVLG